MSSPAMNIDSIVRALSSQDWMERLGAQENLVHFESGAQWLELFQKAASCGINVKKSNHNILCKFVQSSGPVEMDRIFPMIALKSSNGHESFYAQNPASFKELIQSLVLAKRVATVTKIDMLLRFLVLPEGEGTLPDQLIMIVVTTLGKMRAKRAVPFFEKHISTENEALIFEVLKATSLIRDKKAIKFVSHLCKHKNPKVVSTAVRTLSEISSGFREVVELIKLLRVSEPLVRVAVISTFVHLRFQFLAYVMSWLYTRERDRSVRIEIIRSISHIPSRQTIKLLLSIIEAEKDAEISDEEIKDEAYWSFARTDISGSRFYLLRKLKTSHESIQYLILRKLADLPSKKLEPTYKSIARHYPKMKPVIKQVFVEGVSALSSSWVSKWLMNRLKEDYLIAQVALLAILKRNSRSESLQDGSTLDFVVSAIERLDDKKRLPLLKSLLGFLPSVLSVSDVEAVTRKLRAYFKHPDSEIRYLSMQLRVMARRPNIGSIWGDLVSDLDPLNRRHMVTLIAESVRENHALFLHIIDEIVVREGDSDELRILLSIVDVADWDFERWYMVLNRIASVCYRKIETQVQYRNLSTFLDANKDYWMRYFDRYATKTVKENHPEFVEFYVLRKNAPLESETISELMDMLYDAQLMNKKSIISILLSRKDRYLDGMVMDFILEKSGSGDFEKHERMELLSLYSKGLVY